MANEPQIGMAPAQARRHRQWHGEPRVNYDRIMLSPVLSGEKQFEQIIVHDDAWYAEHHVDLRKGETVVAIDKTARSVRTQSPPSTRS